MLNVQRYNPLNITLFLLLNSLNISLKNQTIIKLFKVQEKEEIKLIIIQLISKVILFLFLPVKAYVILDILVEICLYKKFLKMPIEKLYFALIFNLLIRTVSETFFLIKNTYIVNTNLVCILEISINLTLFLFVRCDKLKINVKECLIEKIKNKITLIALSTIIFILILKMKMLENIEEVPIHLYLLFTLIQVVYLLCLTKIILDTLKESNDKILIENLEETNKRLQENYDSVRSFKHDFNNIMQGMGGYIVAKDIDGLNKMYKSIINECQEINDKQSINGDVISNPAILNIINNKIELAEKKSVKIKLEVYIDLKTLKVPTYDLCRILGILIDNAIEACTGCEEKVINIKFLKDKYNNRNLIIIENPYKNYLIDVKKIYEKGFSSKKDKISHGLGLWKVKQILKKNKNIQIYTSRDKLFKQQLEIY